MMFDAKLAPTAPPLLKQLDVSSLSPPPTAVLSSPLTRCLQTAALLFNHSDISIIAEPRLRERLVLSSEIGSSTDSLQAAFQKNINIDFSACGPGNWWYGAPDFNTVVDKSNIIIQPEPKEVYQKRLEELRDYLKLQRPEEVMVIVSHWGVINYLSGGRADLQPGEMVSIEI